MIITIAQLVLSMISGVAVGFTLGLIGGGGSILAIPLLIYFVGIHNTHLAIGTTALAVGVNAYINFFSHRKRVKIKMNVGIIFSLIGAAGVLLGTTIGLLTESSRLLLLFSFLMIGVGFFMYMGKKGHSIHKEPQPEKKLKKNLGKISGSSLMTGFASGFFGIGGGFLIVPALMYSTKININEAIGTSLLVVGSFGILTAIRYGIAGNLLYSVSLFYIIGGIFGGIFGSRISTGMDTSRLKKLFSIIIIIVGIYVMFRTLGFP
ncbi:membrane protein [uncultured archaeon]|nr:membrane protein [uncultured archaeon]